MLSTVQLGLMFSTAPRLPCDLNYELVPSSLDGRVDLGTSSQFKSQRKRGAVENIRPS